MEVTTRLTQEGKIKTRTVKGGAKLYLPGDAPSQSKGAMNKNLEEGDSGKGQEGGWKMFFIFIYFGFVTLDATGYPFFSLNLLKNQESYTIIKVGIVYFSKKQTLR